jgi:hypothetical protein
MTESTTDPLSGLPQPNQGIKPSPLKDAGSINESGGERWWLSDSVQPNEVISEQSIEIQEGDPHSLDSPLSEPSDIDETAANPMASKTEDSLVTDAELKPVDGSSGGKSVLKSLIGVSIAALLLYLIFYGV